ncbi:helix-turn-helix transcriptional regulator [Streptomyces sp. NPDC006332]|uniref:helix-turn-helix domain-containing protein n=1 Tax=Streptomyces sp. NPDC006332 TaxID=3155456 RepID=UPI0033BE13FE
MASTSPRWAHLPIGLGAMLRAARHKAGQSQAALAASVRTTECVLRAVEAELRPPSTEVAERLCDALTLDPWQSAVLLAVAVDEAALRTRRGVRHVNRRGAPPPSARTPSPALT